MAKKYIALKKFGGGKKLRSAYGSGPGRMVQIGTLIDPSVTNETHLKELISLGLIEEFDEKKTYQTQAGRDKRAKFQNRHAQEAEANKDSAKEADKKSDGGTKDDKSGKKDKG